MWNLIWNLIVGPSVVEIISVAVGAAIVWGLWNAKRWAYVLTLVGAILLGVIFIAYVLGSFDNVGLADKARAGVNAAVTGFLVLHPATRAFFAKSPRVDPFDADVFRTHPERGMWR